MTGPVPENFALYAVLAGFGLALVVIALGVWRLVVHALALRKRVEKLAELPFGPTLELTQARVAIASRQADRVPGLLERVRVANQQIADAQASLGASAGTVRASVRAFFGGRP